MRPSFIIVVLLSVASICSATLLFWNEAPKSSSKRTTAPSAVEIKWGEGSEAGSPDAVVHK
jgi:hypothetical protein